MIWSKITFLQLSNSYYAIDIYCFVLLKEQKELVSVSEIIFTHGTRRLKMKLQVEVEKIMKSKQMVEKTVNISWASKFC